MTRTPTPIRFNTTNWTLIRRLSSSERDVREAALQTLSETYWPAVYGYLRRAGRSRDTAADLAQSFFADVVLSRNLFGRARQTRSRLRNLVLTALKRFLIDQYRKKKARDHHLTISIDAAQREDELLFAEPDASPDRTFERRWANQNLVEALRRCEQHFQGQDRIRRWRAMLESVVQPAVYGTQRPAMAELAERLGFEDAGAVTSAVFAVRKRLLAILQEVVAETVGSDDLVDDEYQRMLSLLTGRRGRSR